MATSKVNTMYATLLDTLFINELQLLFFWYYEWEEILEVITFLLYEI